MGFLGGSEGKNPPALAGDTASIPGLKDTWEKEMAAYSSSLAWRIQWTEDPVLSRGGLELQRVGHDGKTFMANYSVNFLSSPPPISSRKKQKQTKNTYI